MNFWKTSWHAAVITLLIGFAAGTFFSQNKRFCDRTWKHGNMKEHMLQKFSSELNLTEEQKEKVSAIFDAKHPKMMALHDEVRPKFEALRGEAETEIREILTPEQQKKFEEMNARMEKKRQEKERFFRF